MADWAKTAAVSAAAVVIALFLAWAAFAQDVPRRDEVRRLIATATPYVSDRAFVLDRLDRIQAIEERQLQLLAAIARLEALLEGSQ